MLKNKNSSPSKRRKMNEDEEIVMDRTIKFKFKCPITCMKLKIPVKGFLWEHVECFDLENFIWINTNFKRFRCPICNKKAVDLYVDILNFKFNKILPPTEKIEIKDDMYAYWDSNVKINLEVLADWIQKQKSDEDIKLLAMSAHLESNEVAIESQPQEQGLKSDDFANKSDKESTADNELTAEKENTEISSNNKAVDEILDIDSMSSSSIQKWKNNKDPVDITNSDTVTRVNDPIWID
jgi:hypothetical protein